MRQFWLAIFSLCLLGQAKLTQEKRQWTKNSEPRHATSERGEAAERLKHIHLYGSSVNSALANLSSAAVLRPIPSDSVVLGHQHDWDRESKGKLIRVEHYKKEHHHKFERIVNQLPTVGKDCDCGKSLAGPDTCPGPARKRSADADTDVDVAAPLSSLDRIVGGQTVDPAHKYPWQVHVEVCENPRKCFMCGGALLNRRWIATAMHCLRKPNGQIRTSVAVSLGKQNLNDERELPYNNYRIDKIVPNPYFRAESIENDIALLRLPQPVVITDQVRPVCLPEKEDGDDYAGRLAVVTGWGNTEFEGDPSRLLQEASVNILDSSDNVCRSGVSTGGYVPKSKLCAYKRGSDACQGDSGGPLVLEENGRCTLVGLTSYGVDCASPGMAGVYTRVDQFLSWIKDTIKDGNCDIDIQTTSESTWCDLTCTNVAKKTGKFALNDIPSECKEGLCKALDPQKDLCSLLHNPCPKKAEVVQESGLKCRHLCNLDFYVGDFLDGLDVVEDIVDLEAYGVQLTCDKKTRDCCQIGDPDENLCWKMMQVYASNLVSSIFG